MSENIRCTYARLPGAPAAAASASAVSTSCTGIIESCPCRTARASLCHAWASQTDALTDTHAMPSRSASPPAAALDLVNLPDADVVALAQQGRETAYRELIRRYERPVFSLIYRMVRDRELAEDLAQDTFIKVLNHIDRYRPEFKLSSWLFKIANNVAIDHLRRRQLAKISIDGSPHPQSTDAIEATSIEIAGTGESALDEMEARELGSEIERAI